MITLPELIERLRPPGRYLALRYDRECDFYYVLCQITDGEKDNEIEAFYLAPDAEASIKKCGNCADFSAGTEDGLAYGPYCSTYSHVDNIERNKQLA